MTLTERLGISEYVDLRSLIFGSAIATTITLIGWLYNIDFAFPFAAIGFLWVGYKGKDMIWGTALGAVSAIPIAIIGIRGGLGAYPNTDVWRIIIIVLVLAVGAFIGFVGAYAHKNREKAKIEYEKKQKIGKNKKNKK